MQKRIWADRFPFSSFLSDDFCLSFSLSFLVYLWGRSFSQVHRVSFFISAWLSRSIPFLFIYNWNIIYISVFMSNCLSRILPVPQSPSEASISIFVRLGSSITVYSRLHLTLLFLFSSNSHLLYPSIPVSFWRFYFSRRPPLIFYLRLSPLINADLSSPFFFYRSFLAYRRTNSQTDGKKRRIVDWQTAENR